MSNQNLIPLLSVDKYRDYGFTHILFEDEKVYLIDDLSQEWSSEAYLGREVLEVDEGVIQHVGTGKYMLLIFNNIVKLYKPEPITSNSWWSVIKKWFT